MTGDDRFMIFLMFCATIATCAHERKYQWFGIVGVLVANVLWIGGWIK